MQATLQEKAKAIVAELYRTLSYAYMPGAAGHTDSLHKNIYGALPDPAESEELLSAVQALVTADRAALDAREEFVYQVEGAWPTREEIDSWHPEARQRKK